VVEKASTAATRTKILLLTDSFLPHAGGSREYYNNIYKNLVQLGDSEVTILTKKVPGWQEFDKKASTELFRIKRLFKPLPSWKIQELPKGIGAFFHTLWHVLRERPAIVHAGDLFPPGVIAMTLKKIFGIPYVVYCHGEEIPQIDQFRYQPRVRNRIYLNADAVIAASEFTRQNLRHLGIKDECIHKITPGVNSSIFRSRTCGDSLRKKYGLEGKVVILTVARLVPRKGHRAALQAFAKICRGIPEAKYLIVGTGPEEPLVRKLVQELGIGDRVTFAGYVASDQLPEVYNMCDIMLMPNRQEENGDVEGFGIVFLEANAAGMPVIGGRSGGAIEAIVDGATGFLVDPDSPAEIAGILRRLLLDRELRKKLGASGKLRVCSDFNWESRAEVLRDINRNILTRYDKQTKSSGKEQLVSDAFADESDHRGNTVSKLTE
jgi:phosphatidylinositol alpha-1,6-mannosyltransferase